MHYTRSFDRIFLLLFFSTAFSKRILNRSKQIFQGHPSWTLSSSHVSLNHKFTLSHDHFPSDKAIKKKNLHPKYQHTVKRWQFLHTKFKYALMTERKIILLRECIYRVEYKTIKENHFSCPQTHKIWCCSAVRLL